MDIIETALPGVLEITPKRFGDHRGFFSETWNKVSWAAAGIDLDFVQDNHSLSATQGTLRGLHFQAPPHAQDKLVRVIAGAIVELSSENGKQLLVPKGYLHGFLTLTPDTQVVYKCTDVYAPDCDGGVRWDDPDIGIDWGVAADAVTLSDKDKVAPLLADFDSPFVFEG